MINRDSRRVNFVLWLGVMVVSVVFYLAWYWLDGIILTEDAWSYIAMISERDPGYCIFLAVMRFWFGEKALDAAVIVQCIVAALAAAAVTLGLRKRFALNVLESVSILMIQYGITLLNRFVAQRRYSYYNSIETEGLCYSLWIFFFLSLLGVIYDHSRRSIAAALLWSVVLISMRKQMLVTLILLVLFLLYAGWKEGRLLRRAALSVLLGITALMATTLIDCSYNYVVRGIFTTHSGDSSFILGTELYLADTDMVESIRTQEGREVFLEIMRRNDEDGYNIAYAREELPVEKRGSFLRNWQAIENHYSLSYDRIKFDIVIPVIQEYQEKLGIPEEMRQEHHNQIVGSMMWDLLGPCIPRIVQLFACNVIHGMITTVLKTHRLLNWAALLIYCVYMALFLYLKRKGACESLPFAAAVIVAMVVNVCFTSLTIYPQMRYMLYNTAFFYQAGAVMFWELVRGNRQKQVNVAAEG